jgi:hypothetical protein
VTLFDFLSLKNDVNVPAKSDKQKKLCYKEPVRKESKKLPLGQKLRDLA